MNTSSRGRLGWHDVSIRIKLILIFSVLMGLLLGIGVSGLAALRSVQQQRSTLLEANQLASLTDDLQGEFVEARDIQRSFLLGWRQLGYSEAVERFLPSHADQIEEIRGTTGEIETLLADSSLSNAPRALRDTRTLAAVADFYEESFLGTVDALQELANERTGAVGELDRRAGVLTEEGASTEIVEVLDQVVEIRQQQQLFQATGNLDYLAAVRSESAKLDQLLAERVSVQATTALFDTQFALEAYLTQVDTVEALTIDLNEQADSLDALVDEAEPIWDEVAALAEEEAAQAEANAARIGGLANLGLSAAIGVAVLMSLVLITVLWRYVGGRMRGLTEAARRLQGGDLRARAEALGADEFGQLALAFNAMARQLEDVVSGLSAQAGERARDLGTIAEISRIIASLRTPQRLLRDVVALVRDRFGFYHAQVFLIDQAGEYAVLSESTGQAGRELLARGHRLAVGSQSVIGQVTATGEPVVALDTDTSAIHRRNELLPDTRSEMALPLRIGDQVMGALDVQSVEPDAFDEDDVAVFQTMADQLAVALQNAQLFEETQAAVAEVETLNRRMVGQVWDRFVSRRDAPRAYRIEEGMVLPAEGLPPDVLDRLGRETIVELDGEENGELRVAVPIRVRGEVIGAFGFGGESLDKLSQEDIALIESVAERVGVALENVRLFEQTQQQARREHLVNEITSKIVGSTDVNDILQTTARELGRVLRSPRTSIQLRGEQDDE